MAEASQSWRSLVRLCGSHSSSQQRAGHLQWPCKSKFVERPVLVGTVQRRGNEHLKSSGSGSGASISCPIRAVPTRRRIKTNASGKDATTGDLVGSAEKDDSQNTLVENDERALNGCAGSVGSSDREASNSRPYGVDTVSGRAAVEDQSGISSSDIAEDKFQSDRLDSAEAERVSFGSDSISSSSAADKINNSVGSNNSAVLGSSASTNDVRDSEILSEKRFAKSYTGSASGMVNGIKRRGLRGTKALRDSQFVGQLLQFMKEANIPTDALPSAKKLDQLGRKDLADGMRLRGMKVVRHLVFLATKAELNASKEPSIQESSLLPKSTQSWITNWNNTVKSNLDGSRNRRDGAGIESSVSFLEDREKRLKQLELIQQTAALLLEPELDKKKPEVKDLLSSVEAEAGNGSAVANTPKASELWSRGIDAVAQQKAALLKASLLRRTLSTNALTLDLSGGSQRQVVEKKSVPADAPVTLPGQAERSLLAENESLVGSYNSKPGVSTGSESQSRSDPMMETGVAREKVNYSPLISPNSTADDVVPTTMLAMLNVDSQVDSTTVDQVENVSARSNNASIFLQPSAVQGTKNTSTMAPVSPPREKPCSSMGLAPSSKLAPSSQESQASSDRLSPPPEPVSEPANLRETVDLEYVDSSRSSQQRPVPPPMSGVAPDVDIAVPTPTKPKPSLLEAAKKFRQSAAFNTFKVFTPITLPPPDGYVLGTLPSASLSGEKQAVTLEEPATQITTAEEPAEDQDETIRLLRKENEELFHDIRVKQQEMETISLRERQMQEEFKRVTQMELLRIKSALEAREAELASMVMEFDEAKGQFALMRARAVAELNEVQQALTDKETRLNAAEQALANLKQVKVEYWGQGEYIQLGGNFNGWMHHMDMQPDLTSAIPQPDGSRGPMMWEIELYLYPGTYQVKFIIDGAWVVDSRRDVIMSGSVQNNIIVVDA